MASRQERMQERMRGAQRYQLQDDSFALDLPGQDNSNGGGLDDFAINIAIEPEPEPEAEPESELQPDPAIEAATTPAISHPRYEPPGDTPSTIGEPQRPPPSNVTPAEHPSSEGPSMSTRLSTAPRIPGRLPTPTVPASGQTTQEVVGEEQGEPMDIDQEEEEGTGQSGSREPTHQRTPSKTGTSFESDIEVQASPDDAPGSGQRHSIRVPSTTSSSKLLNDVLESIDNEQELLSSSPTVRRVQRSGVMRTRVSSRTWESGNESAVEEIPESNEQADSSLQASDETIQLPPAGLGDSIIQLEAPTIISEEPGEPEEPVPEPASPVEAEPTSAQEAARHLGRKRPWRNSGSSPELGASPEDQGVEVEDTVPAEPASKRRKQATSKRQHAPKQPQRASRSKQKANKHQAKEAAQEEAQREAEIEAESTAAAAAAAAREAATAEVGQRSQDSPSMNGGDASRSRAKKVKTKQPTARRGKAKGTPKAKGKSKKRSGAGGEREGEHEGPETWEITVQRFTKEDDPEDIDPLASDFDMFAGQSRPNAVDVLAQACDEVVAESLSKLGETLQAAGTSAEKKEIRIKIQAVDAFREQLRIQLLEHTCLLDNLYSLRKHFRKVAKDRSNLRDDIIRLRAERENVWHQMQVVRATHDADRTEAVHRIHLSSAMHDIDMAIERGRAAPELTVAEQKAANLANLEAQMARIADHVSSKSAGGGALKTVKDLNAFLERAALALESK